MEVVVDYIIVGQGLAGTVLAWELLNRGKKVRVYDVPANNQSSLISAGICNPVTGRAMTETYLANKLFPFLHQWYAAAEQQSGKRFFYPMPLYRPFLSREEQQRWKVRQANQPGAFIERMTGHAAEPGALNDYFGGLWINRSGYLNVRTWIDVARRRLEESDSYAAENFDQLELRVDAGVHYKMIRASRIVFCEGLAALDSKWFGWVPLRPLKGEILSVRTNLKPDKIISRGAYLVPGDGENSFVVGSTYEHAPFVSGITESGRTQILDKLSKLYSGPVEVIHQGWGIRPTVVDRRPLLGGHPEAQNVVIFNGMGTKGVSLTPYFASQLADWMEEGAALPNEVNISRFKSLYSK